MKKTIDEKIDQLEKLAETLEENHRLLHALKQLISQLYNDPHGKLGYCAGLAMRFYTLGIESDLFDILINDSTSFYEYKYKLSEALLNRLEMEETS